MKTYTVRMAGFVAAVIMMAGSVYAGQTQEERDRVLRQTADPEGAFSWQIRPGVETGSLPAHDETPMNSVAGANGEVPTVEIGGFVYRIGIDTP